MDWLEDPEKLMLGDFLDRDSLRIPEGDSLKMLTEDDALPVLSQELDKEPDRHSEILEVNVSKVREGVFDFLFQADRVLEKECREPLRL